MKGFLYSLSLFTLLLVTAEVDAADYSSGYSDFARHVAQARYQRAKEAESQRLAELKAQSLITLTPTITSNIGVSINIGGDGIQAFGLSGHNLPNSLRMPKLVPGFAAQVSGDGSVALGTGVGVPLVGGADAMIVVYPLDRAGNIILSAYVLHLGGQIEIGTSPLVLGDAAARHLTEQLANQGYISEESVVDGILRELSGNAFGMPY